MNDFLFYLSYARRDFDSSLEKFFHDLKREVEERTGEAVHAFMDRENISMSAPFDEVIGDALNRSRVLLALYSPAYFQSEFCGKEWSLFLSRPRQGTTILPVLWSPQQLLRDLPAIAESIQYSDASFPKVYEEQGLRYMLRLGKHKDEYFEFLTRLAELIVQIASSVTLPPPQETLSLHKVDSAFGPERLDHKTETSSDITRRLLAFLCHASGDKPKIRRLYSRLLVAGIDPWLDEKKLLPGQDWHLAITRAVRASDVVIVCFSQTSVTKVGYVQKEMRLVLDVADEQPEESMFLIPVRLEECQVPERFRHLHYADLFEEDGYAKLFNSLRFRANEVGARAPLES